MKIIIIFFFYSFILLNTGCKNKKNTQNLSIEKTTRINNYLNSAVNNTLGLAIAVLKEDTVIYENYLGFEDLNKKRVTKKTIFPLYSLSKLITSTGIFQLLEEKKIKLDDTISLYIDDLPLEWRTIQIKNLLTHSFGLPDYDLMRGNVSDSIALENVFKKKLRFKKGERWEYNQTNFWFLTKIIEKVTNQSFESYILKNQFSEVEKKTLYTSNFIDPIPNRSFKYTFNEKTRHWKKVNFNFGRRANSAGGLNLTLNQFMTWNKKFDQNKFIQTKTKDKMWTPFHYKKPFYFESEKDKFLYGWQQYTSNNEVSYGFTGGLVTGFRKFTNQDITIILLTNGLKGAPIRNKIINKIASIVDEKLIE